MDEFVQADLDQGIPDAVGHDFDVVLAADIIEHHRRPDLLLQQARDRLAPDGVLLLSVPNFGHWYPRVRTASGRFDYDRARHPRQRAPAVLHQAEPFERSVHDAGFDIRRRAVTGLPTAGLSDEGGQRLERCRPRRPGRRRTPAPAVRLPASATSWRPSPQEPLVAGTVSIGDRLSLRWSR